MNCRDGVMCTANNIIHVLKQKGRSKKKTQLQKKNTIKKVQTLEERDDG